MALMCLAALPVKAKDIRLAEDGRAELVRERKDGRFANSCTLIDRTGKIVAIYDKNFPMTTEMDSPEFPIVPGTEAVVAETDFGRLGFVSRENYYMPTFTAFVNTNCRVMHLDFNREKFPDVIRKYGRRVTIRNPGSVGTVTLVSNDPDLPADKVMEEFSLEPLTGYFARSRRVREQFLR